MNCGRITQVFMKTRNADREPVRLSVDEDGFTVNLDIDKECFLDALDDIADSLSEWIEGVISGWLDSYYDSHEQMTEEQLNMIKHFISEARP